MVNASIADLLMKASACAEDGDTSAVTALLRDAIAAAQETPELQERLSSMLEIGQASVVLENVQVALEAFTRSAELVPADALPNLVLTVDLQLGIVLRQASRALEAAARLRLAVDAAQSADTADMELLARKELGSALMDAEEYETAIPELEAAVALADEIAARSGSPEIVRHRQTCLSSLGFSLLRADRASDALSPYERALTLALDDGDTELEAKARGDL